MASAITSYCRSWSQVLPFRHYILQGSLGRDDEQ